MFTLLACTTTTEHKLVIGTLLPSPDSSRTLQEDIDAVIQEPRSHSRARIIKEDRITSHRPIKMIMLKDQQTSVCNSSETEDSRLYPDEHHDGWED
ncbi:hypothetical protein Pmani_025301 [Petrolisthes manimaculis]|uniref:Uncharacterized protein n=1 Tax=Petrolisthes manimaculis TaxID=1843537 RepID=A0AAE1U1B0_9EUCA|nr:hypothetical protein Pmani_025301 [Petrolisthes manimaculis]